MRYLCLWLTLLFTSPAFAQNIDQALLPYSKINDSYLFYDLDFVHCTISFAIQHMGISTVTGTFSGFEGAVLLNEKELGQLSTSFVIHVSSINTNQTWRDKDLQSEKWFHVDKYPDMLFQSSKSVSTANGFELQGLLTIKGRTNQVTLHMETPTYLVPSYAGHHLAFNGHAMLNRKDFAIGEDTWWNDIIEGIAQLDDSVRINLSIIYQLQSAEFIKSRFFENEKAIYQALVNKGIQEAIAVFNRQKLAFDALPVKDTTDFVAITAKDLNTISQTLVIENRLSEAEDLLLHNLKSYPNHNQILAHLANLYLTKGQLGKAKEMVRKCLIQNPMNPIALEMQRAFLTTSKQ
ncbi:MAG: YceI family protein [Cyclobacteriaceae bacterium]